MPDTSHDELLTPPEVADILKLKLSVVRKQLSANHLPGFKLGGVWRVWRSKLEAYLQEQEALHDGPGSQADRGSIDSCRGHGGP